MKALILLFFAVCGFAHLINYDVKQGGVYVSVFYDKNAPASFSDYEIYAPGGSFPYVKGQSDANGIFAFVPQINGKWLVKIDAKSDHGSHKSEFSIVIDENLSIKEIENKPLYATYGAVISGSSIIFGLFSLLYALSVRKKLQVKN